MSRWMLAVALSLLAGGATQAGVKAKLATEAAEWLFAKFGAKAGRSVPELAGQIERVAARYGDDAILAIRKGGPNAVGLVEAAGADGAKAIRVLSIYGEHGAMRVLARPAAMRQYLRYGDDAAAALVKHPGVAESLVEKAGAPAVKALAVIDPRNGRRLAMLVEGELATVGRHPELMQVVASHGDRAMEFIWKNKGILAGGAALAAFLVNPEPFLNGTAQLAGEVSREVVKPAVQVTGRVVSILIYVAAALLLGVGFLLYKQPRIVGECAKALAGRP